MVLVVDHEEIVEEENHAKREENQRGRNLVKKEREVAVEDVVNLAILYDF